MNFVCMHFARQRLSLLGLQRGLFTPHPSFDTRAGKKKKKSEGLGLPNSTSKVPSFNSV